MVNLPVCSSLLVKSIFYCFILVLLKPVVNIHNLHILMERLFCRFSLLLLEPGEIYFEDFAAIYILPNENANNNDGWENKFEDGMLRGRLKVRQTL